MNRFQNTRIFNRIGCCAHSRRCTGGIGGMSDGNRRVPPPAAGSALSSIVKGDDGIDKYVLE